VEGSRTINVVSRHPRERKVKGVPRSTARIPYKYFDPQIKWHRLIVVLWKSSLRVQPLA
jgi:hypothetical protein